MKDWAVVLVRGTSAIDPTVHTMVGICDADLVGPERMVNGWRCRGDQHAYLCARLYAAQHGIPMVDGTDPEAQIIAAPTAEAPR